MHQQKSLMPDKPFFIYFAPGATHAPHHVPPDWIDKYKGQFDQGWDKIREETLRPPEESSASCRPTRSSRPGPTRSRRGTTSTPTLKPILARQMEIYAAFLEHVDHHIGRLLDAIEAVGILDDTLIYCIVGDNGASAEGTPERHVQRVHLAQRRGRSSRPPSSWRLASTSSAAPTAYNHYAVGWAHAMNTPYQWTKQVASHFGGTRNGMIVHWPNGVDGQGRDPDPVPPRDRRGGRPCSTSPVFPSPRS